ncbi:hypothetical protein PHMEG_00019284 [Phytophthora megakarya]|uniref:DUF659 domain-containing protein n=1 Tax=Phytophthora megakarya TaxID=4795 RepID=A0A225VT76_9STRA|nr:hypothetical protein PHMEG_00019284 [Phytophthora megakarya]
MEWQNLALEATTGTRSEEKDIKIPLVPAVERSEYETLRAIPQRPKTTLIQCRKVEASQDQNMPDCLSSDNSPSEIRPLDLASVASEESDLMSIADEDSILHAVTLKEALEDLDQIMPDVWTTDPSLEETASAVEAREEGRDGIEAVNQDQLHSDPSNDKCAASMSQQTDMDPSPVVEDQPGVSDLDLTWDSDQDYDELPVTTEDVEIEDIQLCGSDNQTPEEIDRLRQMIWKFRHLLIGKGNTLPEVSYVISMSEERDVTVWKMRFNYQEEQRKKKKEKNQVIVQLRSAKRRRVSSREGTEVDEYHMTIATFFYVNSVAFRVIENPLTQALLRYFPPDIQLPSHHDLAGPLLKRVYEKERGEMIKAVAAQEHVHLVSDGWSNP